MERTRYFETNLFENSNPVAVYQCGWEKCNSNYGFGPFVRDHYLIHYIVEGQGNYYVGDKTYHLKKGQGFLINPYVSTYYRADEKEPWEYYWVGFNGSHAQQILQNIDFKLDGLIFEYHNTEDMCGIFEAMLTDFNSSTPNRFALMSRLYLFFSLIVTDHHCNNSYIDTAADYIRSNFSYNITVADVARYVGLSRSYFFRLFKDFYNQSPQEYLLVYRLNRAQELLLSTDLNITEIACSCGFSDVSHFSAIFKKRVGMSPIHYRKRAK